MICRSLPETDTDIAHQWLCVANILTFRLWQDLDKSITLMKKQQTTHGK